MVRNPWWGADGRLHVPVEAVLEPNVAASPNGEVNYQAYRQGGLDERNQQSRREQPVNGFLAGILGAALATLILIVVCTWPPSCPTCGERRAAAPVYYTSASGECDLGFRFIRATRECI